MSKVGLTVKIFIEIMRCRILNCRLVSQLCLLHLQCHYKQAPVSLLQCILSSMQPYKMQFLNVQAVRQDYEIRLNIYL